MKPAAPLLFLAAVAACHSSPTLCEPWRDVGFPQPARVDDCHDDRLVMKYTDTAGDPALRTALTSALEQHGFRSVHVRDAGYERAVLRRASDGKQVELTVTGGRAILEDNTDRVAADPDQTLRALATLRTSLAPLADAVPADPRTDRRCDDAALLRADPTLATRELGFFDLDDLRPPTSRARLRYAMPLHDAAPALPAPTDIDDLASIEALLPEATAARIVVGYRITRLSEPRIAGGVDPTTTEGGMPTVHRQFEPGLLAADLIVFDRTDRRALCWTTLVAASSGSVSQSPTEHGNALHADFDRQIARSTGTALQRISHVLHYTSLE